MAVWITAPIQQRAAARQNKGRETCPALYGVNALTQQISLILMDLWPEKSLRLSLFRAGSRTASQTNKKDESLPSCLVLWRRNRPQLWLRR